MKKLVLLYTIACTALPAVAQFAPQAGVAGTTAIGKTDNRIVGWANKCVVERGWVDIADKAQGKATLGSETDAAGNADNYLVSLGDSGIAILTFPANIYNGAGPDIVVFENGFPNPGNPEEAFLELAFVEVSSDGVNYTRFPASSETPAPQVPGAGVYMNARKVNNLAGKYILNYGTPFDLEELKGTQGLDINKITHVRLVDVIGSLGSNGSKDKNGNPVNDPYPTPFPSSGFDLDAVGALYMEGKWPSGIATLGNEASVRIFPNPATDVLNVSAAGINAAIATVTDVTGRQLLQQEMSNGNVQVNTSKLPKGVYYLTLNDGNGKEWAGRFSKY